MLVRKIQYTARAVPQGQTAAGFLSRRGYSVRSRKAIREDPAGLWINGAPARMIDRICDGDLLEIRVREEAEGTVRAVSLPLALVYEDEDLLIVDKPAGMPVHPSAGNCDNTLANAAAHYAARWGRPFVFRCLTRLDQDTSGLVLVAKHHVSAGILGGMLRDGKIRKEYLALARGRIMPAAGMIDVGLSPEKGAVLKMRADPEGGLRAVTRYRTLAAADGASLVLLTPGTGRTHQLRVHMRSLGYPLVGDWLYCPAERGREMTRQALHAARLVFSHPITGETLDVRAALPDDMAEAARRLGVGAGAAGCVF